MGLRTRGLPDRRGKCPCVSTSLVVGYRDIHVSLTARPARMQKGEHCVTYCEAHPSPQQEGPSGSFDHNSNVINSAVTEPKPHYKLTRRRGGRASRAEVRSVWGVRDLSEDLTKAVNASPPKCNFGTCNFRQFLAL